ncbi:MAG: HAMP domain-containing sensor histidine kinase [Lachnospiraceae bacterium]|nr:HAMP domain-containing sensor histidine kinase [Lachnospiraceae bacterium]
MKNKKENQRSFRQMGQQLMVWYVLAMAGFVAALFLFLVISWLLCESLVWQYTNPVYRILIRIKDNLFLFIIFGIIVGWGVITYCFFMIPFRYLGEVMNVAERLTQPLQEPVALPEQMKSIQDKLNLVREQALRNAMLAKEAEHRKNDLIVYLAHDLKTPLTSVIGYLTLLQDEPQISQELRVRYTGIALEKAERLEDLINEFFDITRFNLTALTLEPERVNLSRMLEQITYEFQPILLEKKLSWRLEITPEIWLLCDANKLERVFDNLIRNAVNYSYPQTEILLSLSLQAPTPTVQPEGMTQGKDVQICIRNRGKVIPPEKLERIFEQFFRLDSSRTSATGGAGLGLAIAKEIIELHEGSIQVTSAEESILFTVRLPGAYQKFV